MNSWDPTNQDQPTEIPVAGANADASISGQGGEVSQTPAGREIARPEPSRLDDDQPTLSSEPGTTRIATSTAAKQRYLAWLKDAYGMEQAINQTLENHVNDAKDYPLLQAKLQEHLEQTRHHAELVKGCLERLGESPSMVKSTVANVMGTAQGMVTAPAQDELVKNAIADYAAERQEIASYTALISAARDFDDVETVRVCEEIRRDEEVMAWWLVEYLPTLVQESLRQAATAAKSEPSSMGSLMTKVVGAGLAAGVVGLAAKKVMEGESNMPGSVFVFPILPQRTDEALRIVQELQGPGQKDHEESRRNLGITKERMWIQHMPDQDLGIVYLEAENLEPAFKGLAESKDPLDLWLRDQLNVQGLDPSQLATEPILTWPSAGAPPSSEVPPVPTQSPWRGQVQPGMTVKGADGPSIGHITEVQDTDGTFLLERPGGQEWGIFVPFEAIQAIDNREVTLTVPGNKVAEQEWVIQISETARG